MKATRPALIASMLFMVIAWLFLTFILQYTLPGLSFGDTFGERLFNIALSAAWLLAPLQFVRYFRSWRALR